MKQKNLLGLISKVWNRKSAKEEEADTAIINLRTVDQENNDLLNLI